MKTFLIICVAFAILVLFSVLAFGGTSSSGGGMGDHTPSTIPEPPPPDDGQ